MSKSLPGPLASHYAGGDITVAYALRLTRLDGQVFGFTSHHRRRRIGGVWYEAAQGLDVTSIATSAGLGVDTLELSTTDDGTLFTASAVQGGIWQNTRFLCFRYNWETPPAALDGTEPLVAGTFGQVIMRAGRVVAELRGLQQFLQQPVGEASSKNCRARFGDSRCRFDLATRTHTPSTVTSVASRTLFTASGRAEAADYFTEGEALWITGANAGIRQRVRQHATGGVFTLVLSAEEPIQVGDIFTAIGGCRKRLEDCIERSNVLNFQGEPHRPGVDAIMLQPDVQA